MRGLRIACGLLALTAAFTVGVVAGRCIDKSRETSALAAPDQLAEATVLDVPPLCQHPAFPTGCEVVTATMALRYAGETVTTDKLVDNHLAASRDWYWYNGQFFGPDPAAHFCGDPRSRQSYGCFAPVIRDMLVSFLEDPDRVVDATGLSLPALCDRYLDAGVPVLVWATIGMKPLEKGRSWILPDGGDFVWPAGEHCLLLIGYDGENYYFNDPTEGKQVAYLREVAEQRYAEMGRQALVVK